MKWGVAIALLAGITGTIAPDQMPASPKIILWAWERPEELMFINPTNVGVAFLASTLYLQAGEVRVRPRLQPLDVPSGTTLILVVRIESSKEQRPTLSDKQRRAAVEQIARLSMEAGIAGVQIDFDAITSERAFYHSLINEVRAQLPGSLPLSITALASWCIGDDWLSGLPVAEAVPMLFRMGPDRRMVLSRLESGGDFLALPCRTSLGISTDEPISKLPIGRRIYVFNPKAWTRTSVQEALDRVQRSK